MGGIEPDGSVPVTEDPAETTETTVTTDAQTTASTALTTTDEEIADTSTETISTLTMDETTDSDETQETQTTTTVETSTSQSGTSGGLLYGDVNLDGSVNMADAIFLCKASANIVQLSELQERAADCNGDGTSDSNDSMTLLLFLVQAIESIGQISST